MTALVIELLGMPALGHAQTRRVPARPRHAQPLQVAPIDSTTTPPITPPPSAAPAEAGVAEPPADEGPSLTLADAIAIATGASPASHVVANAPAGGTPAVRIAALRSEEAAARIGQARADVLPNLSAAASEVRRTFNSTTLGITFPTVPGQPPLLPKLVGPFDVVDARVRASETLVNLADWQRVGAARQALAASRADRGASTEAAAQSVALAYLRADRALATVGARESDLGIAEALVRDADAQVRAGISPSIDSTRARTQLATARGGLLVARNALDRARIDLARAIGVDPTARFTLTDTLGFGMARSMAPEDPAAAIALAIQRRPDLAAEMARQKQARTSLAAIRAERLPSLDVAADYGASGSTFGNSIGTYDLSVGVTMPIFDGLRRESRIAEQASTLEESRVRERDVRDQIAADVNGALLDLASGGDQLRVAADGLRLAQEELDQARVRFEKGVAGNIEVINAQASLVRARDAEIDARYAIAVARVALARATGVTATLR